eukprot:TRINITY_DN553_c0_g1_i7.p1 TRINITY_DN553_c0_g1~~TRINITY_DN553_c0_g1_i7.p1  ORF type:complete len:101 (-),score=27.38 TRINITY_DN553_c0_g1_i7:63-365(-)
MCIRDSINAEYGNPHVMEHASGLPALAPQANLTKTEFWTQKVKEIETHTDFKTQQLFESPVSVGSLFGACLLYTSDAADEEDSVDLGGRRIIKKKKNKRI